MKRNLNKVYEAAMKISRLIDFQAEKVAKDSEWETVSAHLCICERASVRGGNKGQ